MGQTFLHNIACSMFGLRLYYSKAPGPGMGMGLKCLTPSTAVACPSLLAREGCSCCDMGNPLHKRDKNQE